MSFDSRKRSRLVRWVATIAASLAAACAQAGGTARGTCELPAQLTAESEKAFPGFKVIENSLLRAKDRRLFESEHGKACPGAVKLDFFGTGQPTYALSLAREIGDKLEVKLVAATAANGEAWRLTPLDDANQAAAPVIWAEPAGKYSDVHGDKSINAPHPVVMFATYESWAIIYSWNGKAVDRVWISD